MLEMEELVRTNPAPHGFVYRGLAAFLLKHGREWPVAASQHVPRFHAWPQACFSNAARLARRKSAQWRYVEGYAVGHVIPVHHAWCVNAQDEVVDPTWFQRGFAGTEYFGAEIPVEVVDRVQHKDCQSVLMNWRRGYPLFREPWEDVPRGSKVEHSHS